MTGSNQYGTITTLDSVLELSSTIAWCVFGLYVGLTFWFTWRRSGMRAALFRLVAFRILVPLLLVVSLNLVSAALVFVLPQQTAVVISIVSPGGIRPQVLRAGLHWIVPILEQDVPYPIYWQTYTMASSPVEGTQVGDDSIRARTSDGQEVRLDCSVIFRIDTERTVSVHIDWQERYVEALIRPIVRSIVRTRVSLYEAREVNGAKRQSLEADLDRLVRDKFAEHGFLVSQFLLRDITFSDEYAAAIEHKQVAKEGIEQKKHEANQMRAEAEGRADAVRAEARAQAEALQEVAKVLANNQTLLTYRYIDKLAPNIRAMLVPNNTPLILPLSQLRELEGEQPRAPATPVVPPGTTPPPTVPTLPQ